MSIKKIRNIFLILFGSVVLGLLLLTIVFCLPVNGVKKHVEESLYDMIDVTEDENASVWRKRVISEKDNFTDYLMVQNATEKVEGQSPLAHAVYVYHYDLANETTWMTRESLVAALKQGTEGMFLREYSKYWHGYLVWLKPLLMCMSWSGVEIFLVIFQSVLLLTILLVSFYKKQPCAGVGVLVTLMFMKPIGMWTSLTLTTCWTIALLAVLIQLLGRKQLICRDWMEEFYLLIGIVTAYMDFLTYPIVTLGIPLCFYLVQSMETQESWRQKLKQLLGLAVFWGIGYIGMWGMKWVVAELTFQTGTLRNAVWSVIYRTEPLDGYASSFSGVHRTLEAVLRQYDSVYYWIGFGVLSAVMLVSVGLCLLRKPGKRWGMTVTALAVSAFLPFCWLILTQNHTVIHCSYTFRMMGIVIMALCSVIFCSLRTVREGKKQQKKL